jgi:general stress protein 26
LENKNINDEAFESFKKAKVVYLITYGKDGEAHSRPMTNFNENPYSDIWFPSYRDTRKVKDIKGKSRTLILYPGSEKDQFYEIEGSAELADRKAVEEKWVWWYLYWHPEMNQYFWFDQMGKHPERVIINIKPEKIRTIKKKDLKLIEDTYHTLIPK